MREKSGWAKSLRRKDLGAKMCFQQKRNDDDEMKVAFAKMAAKSMDERTDEKQIAL